MNPRTLAGLLATLIAAQAPGQQPAPTPPPGAPKTTAPAGSAGAPPTPAPESQDPIQIPFLYGLVIVHNPNDLKPDGVPRYPGLVRPADPLLQTEAFEAVVTPYFQKPLNSAKIRQLQTDIILFYRKHDRPLVDVLFIADADYENGMLQLVVIEGKLGQIRVQDTQGGPFTNRFTDEKWLQSQVRLQPGQPIRQSRLMADLDWLNRNPYRKVSPAFSPGGDFALSDVLLRVEERRPFEASIGYENSGNEVTGEDRLTAGLTWGKAFGLQDHQFSYQFTATPDFEGVRAHVASYTMPLPWRHNLRLFGSYVDVQGDVPDGELQGRSYQGSFRYEVPLPAWQGLQQEFSVGLDFKHNDNDLLYGAGQAINSPNEVFQVAVGYSAVRPDRFGHTAFAGQLYYSPGGVTDLNSDEDFDQAQRMASATYFYGNVLVERMTQVLRVTERARMPNDNYLRWRLQGSIQLADGNLVPSEQFGVGGYATVRGYEEREANGAEGYYLINELRSPAFSPAGLLGLRTNGVDRCEFIAFLDTGMTRNPDLQSGEDPHVILTGVGPGLRYSFGRYVSLRFDYGFPLVDSGVNRTSTGRVIPNDSRAHVGVSVSF